MSNQNKPAFPSHGSMGEVAWEGLTAREYAAIKLRVPDSGTDWLDAMIEKSLLNEFAGKAMQAGLMTVHGAKDENEAITLCAPIAYKAAAEMLKASKGE